MIAMFKFSLTKNAIVLLLSIMTIVAVSCKPGAEKAAEEGAKGTGDLAGMVMEAIPGSTIQYARQTGTNGNLEIEGFVENGKKTGMWIQYGADGDIALINHYVNGMMEGTAMRMSFRNQVDLRTTYKQNELDGPYTAYKFGKVIETREYKNGKLNGTTRTYDDRTFKIKQEVQYKDGLQDGYFKYYDENGNVSLEYQYKNGEKISGGIVEEKK
jgi:antitoxin component YwqK of YwqJK toxin-antitoxin module